MKTIKRILYTSLVDISIPYGPGINERGFIKDMARRFGSDFKVVIPKPSHGIPNELSQADISYLNFARSSRKPFGWLESRLTGCFRLKKIIAEFQPDLVVVRAAALPVPQFVFSHLCNIPFVIKTAGSGCFEAFYRQSILRRLLRIFNEHLISSLIDKCLVVDVASEMQLKSLNKLYPQVSDRSFMVDNGADLDFFSTGKGEQIRQKYTISNEDIVLGYVGNFPMSRGGKEVIDLIKHFHGANSVKGIIVGDSGEAEQCRQYAYELGVSELITVTGQVEFEYIPDFVDAMDIGFSILEPEKQNASEQKVRQYLASGKCVVGTQGSNNFLKGYNFARVVSGVSFDEIVEAVLSLLDEGRSGLSKRSNEARKYAQDKLSIESKNDYRLALWEKYFANTM